MQLRQPGLLLGLRVSKASASWSPRQRRPPTPKERAKLLGDMQKHAGRGLRSTPSCSSRRRWRSAKKGLKGLWSEHADLRQRHRRALSWAGRRELARMAALHELSAPAELIGAVPRAQAAVAGGGRRTRCSTHIERWEPHLHAIYALRPDAALEQARASEARWLRGEPLRPLDGVPVTIKENIATAGEPTPLGTRRHRADAGGRGRAAGGAAARSRRGDPRQDHDARLRHAVVGPVELPQAGAQPLGPEHERRAAPAPAPARRRRRATARCTSAPTSAARCGCRPAGAASSRSSPAWAASRSSRPMPAAPPGR